MVDDENRLKGIVTIDDIVHVVEEEATEDIQKLGAVEALGEPYLHVGVARMIRKRAGWLIVLFLGEMLTASAMANFEEEIGRAVVLAMEQEAQHVSVPGNREYNPGWHTALDLRNLLTISEAISRAAIDRKESRGGHFRDDYPEKKPEFATFNTVVSKGPDGKMQLRRQPIPAMPDYLKAVIEEMK